MFDSLKAAGALAGLMKNKEGLKAAGERVRAKLADLRATGQSGGGAVRVTVDGQMKVLEVKLDPALGKHLFAEEGMAELAGNLIAEAVNDALRQSQMMAQRELAREAEAMGLPDMPGLDKLMGG
ncbi:MAG: YbaB/EbfC family nucleoid-associated protein [Phycisphaerales bacterium]|nr:YbaB/EbfC family nucleoid-associated protein [Phycisphaerales bacterium]